MTDPLSVFTASAIAFYAAHHVGDYWVQTDHQARHKGDAGWSGRRNCAAHVFTYVVTQSAMLAVVSAFFNLHLSFWHVHAALAISGITHWMADRREHGLMFWLARRLPGKANFLKLGAPRGEYEIYAKSTISDEPRGPISLDNPSLGTGAWALDQSWHIFWGVFVAALVVAI